MQPSNQSPADYQQTMNRINDALFVSDSGVISVVQQGQDTSFEFIRSLKSKIANGQAVTAADLDTLQTRTQAWTQPALTSLQNVRQLVSAGQSNGSPSQTNQGQGH